RGARGADALPRGQPRLHGRLRAPAPARRLDPPSRGHVSRLARLPRRGPRRRRPVPVLPRARDARAPFTFFLERAKGVLNDGALFGAGGQGFVRLNFGTPRALLTEGLERML